MYHSDIVVLGSNPGVDSIFFTQKISNFHLNKSSIIRSRTRPSHPLNYWNPQRDYAGLRQVIIYQFEWVKVYLSAMSLPGCVSSGDVYESRLYVPEFNSLNLRLVVWKTLVKNRMCALRFEWSIYGFAVVTDSVSIVVEWIRHTPHVKVYHSDIVVLGSNPGVDSIFFTQNFKFSS